jgi:hypothetical protein
LYTGRIPSVPDPGSGDFSTPASRIPNGKKGRIKDENPDQNYEKLRNHFCVITLLFLGADPGWKTSDTESGRTNSDMGSRETSQIRNMPLPYIQ